LHRRIVVWFCNKRKTNMDFLLFPTSGCINTVQTIIHPPESTMYQNEIPDAATLARLHDRARAEASRLRSEAVDEFWRGADAVWQRGLHSGQAALERSTARLQARLARHTSVRNGRHLTPEA
jgi:hypothetical protein